MKQNIKTKISFAGFSSSERSGFTLIEILVAIGILMLLGEVLFLFQRDLWRNSAFIQNSLVAESEARGTLKSLIAELRSAAPGNDGSYSLAVASSTNITFYADLDNDGVRERVRYFVQTGQLMKGTVEPAGPPYTYSDANEHQKIVVHNLTNGATGPFLYYGDDYDGVGSTSPLATPTNIADVRLIGVTITIDADPNRTPTLMTFQGQVTIRNLKDNM